MDTKEQEGTSNSKYIKKLENGDYQIGTLWFDPRELILYTPDKGEVVFNSQQGNLLLMFLEAYRHFLTREEIIERFWPEKVYDPKTYQDRLNMAIKRLRLILKADENIKVKCRPKKGYKLCVEGEGMEDENS